MGCDGGTIPKRDELVRIKKKPEQKDRDSELNFRWRHCNITQQPLQSPIVACGLGRLYSKLSVIECLLDKTKLPDTSSHIKNLKDVKELKLTDNPTFDGSAEKGDGYIDRQTAPYICPVIGLEMSGKFKFCFLWSCGCVISERALKTIKTNVCHKCQQPFTESDVIILNASDEDLNLMQTRLEARQARQRSERKAKKESTSTIKVEPEGLPVIKAMKGPDGEKRPTKVEIPNPVFKKTKGDYSVAKDPAATEVFKSLFTTHDNAKTQTKAHWVTYNPFYN